MKNIKPKIRLLIIEDNRILRIGLMSMLKTQRDIQIIGASGNSKNTILKIHNMKPNVILIDLGLRSQKSLQMVDLVKKEFPEAKLIVMDLAPVKADILMFVKAGASGFVLKDATLEDFLSTVRAVADGEKVLPAHSPETFFTQIIDYAMRSGKTKLRESARITKREHEIMELLSDAHSSQEIAKKLMLSTSTVKSQIHSILEKLSLHTRLEGTGFESDNKTLADGVTTIQK